MKTATRTQLTRAAFFVLFVLMYAWAFLHAYENYLNPVWDYFGFKMSPLTADRLALGVAMIVVTALTQKSRIDSPAAFIVFILYINVYIPCVITSLLLADDAIDKYGSILLCLTLVFVATGLSLREQPQAGRPLMLSLPLEKFIFFIWAMCCIILLLSYYDVMGVVPLDDQSLVYEQRVAGTASNPLLGYLQTFFSNIFNPTVLLIGLMRKRVLHVVGGLFGGVLMYSITAQRTILILPAMMILVFVLLNSRRTRHVSAYLMLGILAAIMVLATSFHEENLLATGVALLFTFRTIAIPGLTVSQYEDLFSEIGRTYWSHVKGIDWVVAAPDFALNDPLWPNLGYIVGEKTYNNPIFNVNANLFAGDGVAAAGTPGVLIIGLIFIIWLKVVERVARSWHPLFTTLALMPPAISLTNGHFFTTMLSFGGIFWLLALRYFKPSDPLIEATVLPLTPVRLNIRANRGE